MDLQRLNLFVPLFRFSPEAYVRAASQPPGRLTDTQLLQYLRRNDLDEAVKLINRSNVNTGTENGVSALQIAIKKNDARRVEQLLALGADIYRPNVFYQNGIDLAANFAGEEVWQKIINSGRVNVNETFHSFNRGGLNYTNSLLNLTAECCNLGAVKALIANGANINFINGLGFKALDTAILGGAIDIVEYLAQQTKPDVLSEDLSKKNRLGGIDYPLLQFALFAQDEKLYPQGRGFGKIDPLAVFEFLLGKQADPYQLNSVNENAFDAAIRLNKDLHLEALTRKFGLADAMEHAITVVKANSFNLLESLFSAGLNPNGRLRDSSTLLHFAVRKRKNLALEAILSQPTINVNAQTNCSLYQRAPLHVAVLSNNREAVRQLIDHKNINLNIQDRFGYTPLHYAVKENNISMVADLLRAGANHRLKARGKTPLQFGLVLGDSILGRGKTKTIIDHLLKIQKREEEVFEANIPKSTFSESIKHRTYDQNQYGIFQAIAENKSHEVAPLLAKGLDPNLRFWNSSYCALHYAVKRRDIVAINALIADPRTDVNTMTDKFCFSPLHLAVLKKNPRVVEALLSSGRINPNQQDIFGATPLHYAVKLGNQELIQLLTRKGAKTRVLTTDHDPLSFAYLLGGRKGIKRVLGSVAAAV